MVQRRESSVQTCVVIENCLRAVNISRCAGLLRDVGKIDILAVEMPVAITEGMHVVAAFVPSAEGKISDAWHKRLYNFPDYEAANLNATLRIAIKATPIEK